MTKEKLKRGKQNHTSHLALHTSQTGNPVGAGPVSARNKKQNGITLIALVITIIVMLILVGVSVTVALNGGLFSTAKEAAEETATKRNEELNISDEQVEIDGKKYASYKDYLNNKEMIEWTVAETKPEGWSENVTAITDGTNVIPLPNGFKLSTEETEDSIEEGLVLKDGTNEFVWIPVANSAKYTEYYFGPNASEADYISTYYPDSQKILNYYYGMQEDGITPYYNIADFTDARDKTNVENSIKTYGGFYVGRYETTIDGNTIGVQRGKTVLTCATLLKEGTNETSNDEYHYRWYGLYKAQKDMYAENDAVGSIMISAYQWQAIMAFTGYGEARRGTDTYTTKPALSGSAYSTDSTKFDVSKNIYDLAGNVHEFSSTGYGEAPPQWSCGRLLQCWWGGGPIFGQPEVTSHRLVMSSAQGFVFFLNSYFI